MITKATQHCTLVSAISWAGGDFSTSYGPPLERNYPGVKRRSKCKPQVPLAGCTSDIPKPWYTQRPVNPASIIGVELAFLNFSEPINKWMCFHSVLYLKVDWVDIACQIKRHQIRIIRVWWMLDVFYKCRRALSFPTSKLTHGNEDLLLFHTLTRLTLVIGGHVL